MIQFLREDVLIPRWLWLANIFLLATSGGLLLVRG